MSKRMTSETIIFDTEWLTEADFEKNGLFVKIDYQAYDTLKIITSPVFNFEAGGVFQEFDVYKLDNFGLDYYTLLQESNDNFLLEYAKVGDDSKLTFSLNKSYWETNLKGIGSIYIKGVKR